MKTCEHHGQHSQQEAKCAREMKMNIVVILRPGAVAPFTTPTTAFKQQVLPGSRPRTQPGAACSYYEVSHHTNVNANKNEPEHNVACETPATMRVTGPPPVPPLTPTTVAACLAKYHMLTRLHLAGHRASSMAGSFFSWQLPRTDGLHWPTPRHRLQASA